MKLAVFATHPVQYHTALWRSLAAVPGLDLRVFYLSDHGVREGVDPGFGVPVAWDAPLLEGYPSTFLSRDADIGSAWGLGIADAAGLLRGDKYDWVLLQGYTHRFERQVLGGARASGVKVLLRGEFCDLPRGGRLRSAARDVYLSWFYSRVHAFCAIGEAARQHLLRRGIDERRIFRSRYHVDSARFEDQAARHGKEECRASLGIERQSRVLLFSGKSIPRKEPLLLLDAIGRLPNLDGLDVIFLGDGPLHDQVLSRGRAVLGSRFHAPGFVNQSGLGRYFAAADAMVLPSNYETWGLVVNEAMYFGLPSVVSDRVGCRADLVRDGKTGYVFRSGDVVDLSRALNAIISDRAKTKRLGDMARLLVREYSTEAARDGILRALESFLTPTSR